MFHLQEPTSKGHTMYRPNFYGQSECKSKLARNFWPDREISISSALIPSPMDRPLPHDSSFFTSSKTTFEQKLICKLDEIRKHEDELKKKVTALKNSKSLHKERSEILAHYSAIERSKKIISMFIEHMQKSLQTIAANFH